MNPIFVERENIRLIIGAGDGMRKINENNIEKIITELEGDNLLEKYNAFICKPFSMDYYPLNFEYLSQFNDENGDSRDYQLHIYDMNDNEGLIIFEDQLKNKVDLIDIQINTWYFITNPKTIKTCIEVLKIGGKFKFPFRLNNSRYYENLVVFKKRIEENIQNVSCLNIVYSEKTQKYICFKNGKLYFPNASFLFNFRTYGRLYNYFNIIRTALHQSDIIYKINNFKNYLEESKKDKIEFSEVFNDFYIKIITQYNFIFSQNSDNLRCTEDDIDEILNDTMGLFMFLTYFIVIEFTHKIKIDIDEENKIIIQRIE